MKNWISPRYRDWRSQGLENRDIGPAARYPGKAALIERLLGKGFDLRIYDKNVNIASLVRANRDFILNRIPHISRLMVNRMEDVLQHAETVVIGNKDPDFRNVPEQLREDQTLVDFVRISEQRSKNGKHNGICW